MVSLRLQTAVKQIFVNPEDAVKIICTDLYGSLSSFLSTQFIQDNNLVSCLLYLMETTYNIDTFLCCVDVIDNYRVRNIDSLSKERDIVHRLLSILNKIDHEVAVSSLTILTGKLLQHTPSIQLKQSAIEGALYRCSIFLHEKSLVLSVAYLTYWLATVL
jgi:hypothetical protein